MPEAFDKCVKGGGRVRRISRGGKYFNLCWPKGGGPSVKGETHKPKKLSTARKKHA